MKNYKSRELNHSVHFIHWRFFFNIILGFVLHALSSKMTPPLQSILMLCEPKVVAHI